MNLTNQLKKLISINILIIGGLLFYQVPLQSQRSSHHHLTKRAPAIQDNNLEQIRDDTIIAREIFNRLNNHLRKGSYIKIDSLRILAHEAITVCKKLDNPGIYLRMTYNALGRAYSRKNYQDSARFYLKLGLQESIQNCDGFRHSLHYLWYGWTFTAESNWDSAIYIFKKSIDEAAGIKDTSLIQAALGALADTYKSKGDIISATKESFKQLYIAELTKDTGGLIHTYCTLSGLFSSMGLFDKEVQMAYNALELVKDSVSLLLSKKYHYASTQWRVYSIASDAYLNQMKYDSALLYARLNLPFYRRLNAFPACWEQMADAHFNMNHPDSAKYYYTKLLDESLKYSIKVNPSIYLGLGQCEFKNGNYKEAIKYYRMAETVINEQDIFSKQKNYKLLSEYFEANKDYQTAFTYFKKYKILEDSIREKRDAFNAGIINLVSEAKQMEGQIDLLTQNNALQATLNSKQKQQRNTVYSGIGITMLLAIFGFTRYRRIKTLKAKQTLMNERLRISRDLHDEVGATLSGLAMYSHLAKEQVKNADAFNAENSLNIMQKSAGDMVNKLSDIIWLMNPEQDTIFKLFERLEEYARQMAATKNMQVKIELPSGMEEIHLPLEVRRNIYLFCKEAINNAVKYSEGTTLELYVKVIENNIKFSVRDDGKGFDEITVKNGNGLKNMRKRAEEIGATLNIGSNPIWGTEIEMHYKLA